MPRLARGESSFPPLPERGLPPAGVPPPGDERRPGQGEPVVRDSWQGPPGERAQPGVETHPGPAEDDLGDFPMTGKTRRLEEANQDRAEAAVRWEESDHRAQGSGLKVDAEAAKRDDQRLKDADRKIRQAEGRP